MDLIGVSTELYGLDPAEFTASRNALAKQARAEGDRDLADQIKNLRKPSTAAWAVNLLARHHPETVADLLDLGAALQQAQHSLDGERLRELGRERRLLTRTVVDQAQSLAAGAGNDLGAAVRSQVEQTVRAAITDADAGTAIADGRLTEALTATGWPATDAASLLAAPPSPRPAAERAPDKQTRERQTKGKQTSARADRQRERALAEARGELRDADRAIRAAQEDLRKSTHRLSGLTQRHQGVEETAEDLRRRLRKVEQQVAELDDDLRAAQERSDDAERREQEGRDAAEQARQKIAGLE